MVTNNQMHVIFYFK